MRARLFRQRNPAAFNKGPVIASTNRIAVSLAVFLVAQPAIGGNGIASKYPCDSGIENDPAIVFLETFKAGSLDAIAERWESVEHREILCVSQIFLRVRDEARTPFKEAVNSITLATETPSVDDIVLGVPAYDSTDKTVTVPILRAHNSAGSPLTGTFTFEIHDEDNLLLYSKVGTWGDNPAADWTNVEIIFRSSTVQAGGKIIFQVAPHLAYKIRMTTSGGPSQASHERTIVVAPSLPPPAPGMTRITAFDGRTLTEVERASIQAEFDGWQSGNLGQFAAQGVAGLTHGLRNALARPNEAPGGASRPSVHIPVNGGPAYFRSRVTTARRCQFFLSIAGGTSTTTHTLRRNIRYRFGGDFRIPANPGWWDSFRSTPHAYLAIWGFHVDNSGDIDGSKLPGESFGLYLYSLGDPAKAPSLQIRITGDERVNSIHNSGWSCGKRDDDGRWFLCYPLSTRHHWPKAEHTLRHQEFEPGRWYRFLTDFVLDSLGRDGNGVSPPGDKRRGRTHVWINEIQEFGEDAGSQVIKEENITNCFLVKSNDRHALCAREPQLGTDHQSFRLWTPPRGEVQIDHANFFLDTK